MREDLKKILMVGGGLAFLAVLVFYGIYQGRDLLFGSKLTVSSTQSSDSSFITLSGIALHSKQITIDGLPAALDANGTFNESIALLPGENIIQVSSVNPFGRTKTDTIYADRPETYETAVNIPPLPGTPPPTTVIN